MSERQVIPDDAVEAAAKVHYEHHLLIWEDAHPLSRAKVLDEMRAALEAAAPHMLAAAWDEGYMFSYDQERGGNGELPIPVPEYLADDLTHWNPHRTPDAR